MPTPTPMPPEKPSTAVAQVRPPPAHSPCFSMLVVVVLVGEEVELLHAVGEQIHHPH